MRYIGIVFNTSSMLYLSAFIERIAKAIVARNNCTQHLMPSDLQKSFERLMLFAVGFLIYAVLSKENWSGIYLLRLYHHIIQ